MKYFQKGLLTEKLFCGNFFHGHFHEEVHSIFTEAATEGVREKEL